MRTKSPGLNHPGISTVATGFHFKKQLLDFPSNIAHGSTTGPFKNHFSKAPFFGKQNTNSHTTPDSSIPVDTDYSNRFSNSTQRGTLYPLVRFLRSHHRETRMSNLFLSSHVLTLTVILEGVRPPPCPNRTKHSPSLSSWCSPAFITLGFGPYKFRLSDCPYSLEWLYLS
jgi:hypothetical protein